MKVAFLVGRQGGFTKFQCYLSWVAEIQLFTTRRAAGFHEPAMRMEFTA